MNGGEDTGYAYMTTLLPRFSAMTESKGTMSALYMLHTLYDFGYSLALSAVWPYSIVYYVSTSALLESACTPELFGTSSRLPWAPTFHLLIAFEKAGKLVLGPCGTWMLPLCASNTRTAYPALGAMYSADSPLTTMLLALGVISTP